MKAFLIARVSTDDQSDALPGQIYRLKDYAARKDLDYELFEIKESAYKGNRASFKDIIDQIVSEPDVSILVFDKMTKGPRIPQYYHRDLSLRGSDRDSANQSDRFY